MLIQTNTAVIINGKEKYSFFAATVAAFFKKKEIFVFLSSKLFILNGTVFISSIKEKKESLQKSITYFFFSSVLSINEC